MKMKNRTSFLLAIQFLLITAIGGAFLSGQYVSKGFAQTSLVSAKDWDITLLDTARKVSYLSDIEKDVVLELNKVRSNPQKYAEMYIKPRLAYFDGSYGGRAYSEPGKVKLLTNEGKKAVEECYKALNGAKSLPPIKPSPGISQASRNHVQEQGKKGSVGHNRADGSKFSDAMNRYGRWSGSCAENISYGADNGREIVIQLLIDDGVPSRGHWKNIMTPSFCVVGVAFGPHAKYGKMCVMIFANSYTEK